jgi:hypothetical protein
MSYGKARFNEVTNKTFITSNLVFLHPKIAIYIFYYLFLTVSVKMQ